MCVVCNKGVDCHAWLHLKQHRYMVPGDGAQPLSQMLAKVIYSEFVHVYMVNVTNYVRKSDEVQRILVQIAVNGHIASCVLPTPSPQNIRALSTERLCCIRRTLVLCLLNICAMSAECWCIIRSLPRQQFADPANSSYVHACAEEGAQRFQPIIIDTQRKLF